MIVKYRHSSTYVHLFYVFFLEITMILGENTKKEDQSEVKTFFLFFFRDHHNFGKKIPKICLAVQKVTKMQVKEHLYIKKGKYMNKLGIIFQ